MDIKIHTNFSIPWQVEYSKAFFAGVPGSEITNDPHAIADIHIVLGPHFSPWRTDNTILVDRCYYKGDPEHVSISWLKDGHKVFYKGKGRTPPKIKEKKISTNKTIFLADYQGKIEAADTIRYHPSERKSKLNLKEDLLLHDIAVGYETSALVEAALLGLKVISKYSYHILNAQNWVELLPYADWSIHEIYSGEAWQHLIRSQHPLQNL